MTRLLLLIVGLIVAALTGAETISAQPLAQRDEPSPRDGAFLLGPPQDGGPVVVRVNFEVQEISAINDEAETFEFSGVLTLKWLDKRQAFDPAAAGVHEKVYQGDYQFNELSPSWFPQLVLVNSAGSHESSGVTLRVQPDGSQTLIQKISAVAKTQFNLRRFPFDKQHLKAVFEVLGFDTSEVVLQLDPGGPVSGKFWIPQWKITGIDQSIVERPAPHAGRRGVASAFVTSINAQREAFYVSRLVSLPLVIIVLLSFSVFWMDRASLGDRISVSFIGILTAVAYQIVMSEILPRIAYVTWMNAFLNFSFLMMVGTVVVNLVAGRLDSQGRTELADRIDHLSRWVFPFLYFALILFASGVAFLVY